MIIGEHELNSSVAKKVTEYLEARLQDLRKQNDSDHDAVKTASIRGAIAEVKKLQKGLEKTPPLKAVAENRNPYA